MICQTIDNKQIIEECNIVIKEFKIISIIFKRKKKQENCLNCWYNKIKNKTRMSRL